MDLEPRDQQPAQDVPVQEQPREGNGERRERRPAAEQPQARVLMPPARGRTRDNNQRANEGANIDANADADAPPLFRRASQNLTVVAMLLRGCPEAATSEERCVCQQLKALLEAAAAQQAESSASRQRLERGRVGAPSVHGPNPPPSQHRERGEGGGAAASSVKSRLGPNRDEWNTIEARRWAESVYNHHNNRSHYHDDRGCGDATTATTTATVAGHRTREVHRPLVRASRMQGSPRVSALRPMYPGTTGTPTPACGSRTIDSPATLGCNGQSLRHQEPTTLPR
jgi:hypothetical protein